MGLESATYINQLTSTNPLGSDLKSAGDDHLRLIKTVLVNSFPAVDGAVTATDTEMNYLVGLTSAVQTQITGKVAKAGDTVTGGFSATSYNAGTKSTGTYTPAASDGNFQYAVNGGAHTLAPPSTDCTIVIQYTNNASAGAITTSGFTKRTGSSFTTTNGDDFMCYITKVGSFSHLHVQALQ